MPNIIQSDITGLYTRDATGRVDNKVIMLVAGMGSGKTLHKNNFAYTYKKDHGYIWISFTDEKDNFELAFSMFEPKEKWHLDRLKYEGKTPQKDEIVLWHPFTFNLPQNKHPKINLFTIPINSLGREEVSAIIESDMDKQSIKLFFDSRRKLKEDEGISDLLYYVNKSITLKTKISGKKDITIPDPDSFYLPSKSAGTSKTMSELISHFKPYVYSDDFFLTPDTCELNLNVIDEIFKQPNKTHILITKYIKDRKKKDIVILWFLKNILRHRDDCKKPLLLDFEEIRHWLPKQTDGWKSFIAQNLKEDLSIIRSKGKGGNTVILTTQVYDDVNDNVRDSVSPGELYIGSLGNISDLRKISTALKLSTLETRAITNLGRNEFYKIDKDNQEMFKLLTPPFMHAEEKYDFFEMYRKHASDKPEEFPMMTFTDIKKYMNSIREHEMKRAEKRGREIKNEKPEEVKSPINEKLNKMVIQEYEKGKHVVDIATIFNIKLDEVYQILDKEGKPIKNQIGES